MPEDLKALVESNYLLQAIKTDKGRGYQSIKCACGKKTALLERV
jgi:hypothetical protein